MNKLQQMIYNEGERLVPYVSHNDDELVRHRSSYAFFHAVIASDIARQTAPNSEISIADLGFGSGYGCALLSSLTGSRVTGVDIGPECETFARQYYPRSNVGYEIADLARFIPEAAPYDYVVSRGVLEHVPGGLDLIRQIKYRRRVMVDVPYDEEPGNEHHLLTGIKEDAFSAFADCELFYEDLEGRIYDANNKPLKANMIMVVMSAPDLPRIRDLFQFPIEPVRDTKIEDLSRLNLSGSHYEFETRTDLLAAVERAIKETDVVMDIGCGIVPMNYFRPKLHLLVEPWKEYSDILAYRYAGDKSVVILRTGALEALQLLGDNSVDSIFLLDVIEHMEKEVGRQVLREAERVAREQIVVFTPLGFMPQHMEGAAADGWGLGGTTVQEHLSGWEPSDFGSEWDFYINKTFHTVDYKREPLDQVYGAFYAVRNFEKKLMMVPEKLGDFRPQLPSEIEADRLKAELREYAGRLEAYKATSENWQRAYEMLLNSKSMRLIRRIKRVLSLFGG